MTKIAICPTCLNPVKMQYSAADPSVGLGYEAITCCSDSYVYLLHEEDLEKFRRYVRKHGVTKSAVDMFDLERISTYAEELEDYV